MIVLTVALMGCGSSSDSESENRPSSNMQLVGLESQNLSGKINKTPWSAATGVLNYSEEFGYEVRMVSDKLEDPCDSFMFQGEDNLAVMMFRDKIEYAETKLNLENNFTLMDSNKESDEDFFILNIIVATGKIKFTKIDDDTTKVTINGWHDENSYIAGSLNLTHCDR